MGDTGDGKEAAKRREMRYRPANRRGIRRNADAIGAKRREPRMRDGDSKLIALLKTNAREPAASLARKLGLARSTVQERIARLEREKIIKGYTVRLADDVDARTLRAVVMITADPKQAERVGAELKKMAEVRSLSAVSGAYDMMAMVEADTPAKMDAALDRIGRAHGVARTVSSIVLSEKFSR
jgi:DNA-binding Lrp family transcriptional regulator